MLAVNVLDTPKATGRDGRLVRTLGDLGGGGGGADAVLGGDAKHGGAGEGAREPGEKARHVGSHSGGGENGEKCDDESDEGRGCEA